MPDRLQLEAIGPYVRGGPSGESDLRFTWVHATADQTGSSHLTGSGAGRSVSH